MYEIKEDKVLREGEEVAVIEEGEVKEYVNGGAKYRLPISKLIKSLSGKTKKPDVKETWKLSVSEAFPDAPGLDSAMGDKNPELVRWIHENHPEDYAIRYKNRKTIVDSEKPQKEKATAKAVRAQYQGSQDALKRSGFDAKRHGFEGIFEKEYKKGYINAGGRV
jgi:hypothetical protein